jgi:hypothetical protein
VKPETPKLTPTAVEPEMPEKGGGKGYGVPKTGDNFPLKIIGMVAAIAAAMLYFISRRYRKLK